MTTTTNVKQVKLNIMTQNQYNSATKNANELYMITDAAINYNDLTNKPTIPTQASDIGAADTNLSNITDAAKIMMSGSGMPSTSHYDVITVGSSGASYSAPSNGWVVISGVIANYPSYVVAASSCASSQVWGGNAAGNDIAIYIPVKKGDTYSIYYYNVSSVSARFYYAIGSESEDT